MRASSMQQINSNQPCEICGDIGYPKDIVTCSKCQKSREHIYCMNPPTFLRLQNHGFVKHANVVTEIITTSARKICQKTWAMGNLSSKVPDARKSTCLLSKFVPNETGKVEKFHLKDIYALSSGSKPKPSSLQGGSSPQMDSFGPTHRPISKRTSVAPANDHAYKSTGHPKPLTIGKVKTSTPQKQLVKLSQPLHCLKSPSPFPSKCSTSENFKSVAAITLRYKRRTSGKTHCSPLNHLGPVVYGVQKKCEFENTLPGLEKNAGKEDFLLSKDYICKKEPVDAIECCDENGTSNSKPSFKFGEEDLPNPPAVNASWKGSFEILNFTNELHVQAYPPGKVSPRVYLVSKEMPRVLQFTLQPRRDVWPETFHTDSPSGFDIGLYLCPDDFCRSTEKYNRLLELMENQDLSMRSCLNGVELLVFTSRQLPVESRKMNRQFYLWGVFHSVKEQHCSIDLKREQLVGVGVREVDDMAGEKEVGRDAWRNCLDMPSLDVFYGVQSHQPVQKSVIGRHLHQVKREHCDDFDVPGRADKCLRSNSRAACWDRPTKDVFSGAQSRQTVAMHLDQCDDFDVPPGSLRPITSDATDKGIIATSLTQVSPVTSKVDAPPGFFKSIKLKERDSSSKVKRKHCDDFDVPSGLLRSLDAPALSRPVTSYITENGPIAMPLTKALPVAPIEDCPPGFLKTRLKGMDSSSKMKREHYDDFDAHGFSRSLNAPRSSRGVDAASLVKMSPVALIVDARPGFSNQLKPKGRDSSSKDLKLALQQH